MRFRDRQRNRHCIKEDIAGKVIEASGFKFPGQRQKPKSARKSDEGRENVRMETDKDMGKVLRGRDRISRVKQKQNKTKKH